MSDPDLSFAASRKGSGQSGHPFQSIRPPIPEISEKVAGLNRNQWPLSIGTGGRIRSESMAGFRRNTHEGKQLIIRCEQRLSIAGTTAPKPQPSLPTDLG